MKYFVNTYYDAVGQEALDYNVTKGRVYGPYSTLKEALEFAESIETSDDPELRVGYQGYDVEERE